MICGADAVPAGRMPGNRALEGNRTPVRGSTVPYTSHYTTRATGCGGHRRVIYYGRVGGVVHVLSFMVCRFFTMRYTRDKNSSGAAARPTERFAESANPPHPGNDAGQQQKTTKNTAQTGWLLQRPGAASVNPGSDLLELPLELLCLEHPLPLPVAEVAVLSAWSFSSFFVVGFHCWVGADLPINILFGWPGRAPGLFLTLEGILW